MAEKESRTEAATPAHLIKALSEGGGVTSREVTTFAALGAAALVFITSLRAMTQRFAESLSGAIAHADQADSPSAIARLVTPMVVVAAETVLIVGVCVGVAAIIGTVLQTGLRLRPNAMRLHFDRLNPLGGLKNLFSPRHAIASVQSIAKIICVGAAIYFIADQHIVGLFGQIARPAADLPTTIGRYLVTILIAGVATQGVIAALDFVWSKRQFATHNQMSQEEIKEEQKEIDGNPVVKAKLKSLRAQQAKRNLRAAMARATVVVTNPTHYAVALEYHAGQTQAPKIVAKGADHLAARIREMAFELRIPQVPNPPLARALFAAEEDTEIAPEHYRAVAEVIAYVWKLAERKRGGTPPAG